MRRPGTMLADQRSFKFLFIAGGEPGTHRIEGGGIGYITQFIQLSDSYDRTDSVSSDWIVVDDDPQAFEIWPSVDQVPGLSFLASTEPKSTKNRLHIDLRPDDRDAEVDRLIKLGVHRVDIGQGDTSWVVLADPENKEFCILSAL